jgi:ubiquinone/menaquinone biosynthesis C-methylase UbiE
MHKKSNAGTPSSLSFPRRIFYSLFSRFFYLLYHQLAWTYDWVAAIVSLGSWQKWVSSVTPYLAGPKVLEIGFGPGHLQEKLCLEGRSVFGLDESSQMADISKKRLLHKRIHPNLVRGEAYQLPFADRSFNQVALTFPAEFILQASTMREIHRVLNDGGLAVILPMAWITGQAPVQRAAAWVNRITGEAPEFHEKSLEPFYNLGFDIQWEIEDLGSSKILLIRMLKLPNLNKD